MSMLQNEAAARPAAAPVDRPKYKGKTGAQILHEMLVGPHKVDTMFGYPGGAILPMFDQLYKTPAKFILNRHEQSSGHCADGYARATGKVGVCIVTSGPGATNTVTPLATAQMDSVPIIVFSGQVATAAIGNDAFQEADVTGITRPCTKWNYLIKDVRELPRIVNEAFLIATSGRPGPVLIDLPKDVQVTACPDEVDDTPREHILKRRKTALAGGSAKQVQDAAELINASERPVLYVGGGAIISDAWQAVRKLAAQGNIPCTTTLLGMGAFDELDPLALHMLGMHGSAFANYAVQESDCLIAVGARFDDRVTGNLATFAPHAKIIHIDVDPSSISKNVDVDVPVVGDAKASLEAMLPHIEFRDRKEWMAKVKAWKERYPFRYLDDSVHAKPQYVLEEINKQTRGDAIFTTGVGQHQMWAAQFIRWRYPRQMITSGGLGTMGYGLPSAMGAQLGSPGKTVIDIDGDASYLMTCYGAGHHCRVRHPGEGVPPEQRLPGHGQAVAGPVLRQAVQQHGHEEPELRQDGRGLRGPRHPVRAQGRRREDGQGNARPQGPGRGRLLRRPRGARLPDGPQRQGAPRDGAGVAGVRRCPCLTSMLG